MRDGNLIEQHISDLIWMVSFLSYTGLLRVTTETEVLDIYFKNGFLLNDNHSIHPVDILHRVASIANGEFVFFDGMELETFTGEIEIRDYLPSKLIQTSKENAGFPYILYSNEVMGARISQIRLARFPGNISPSTKKLFELCSDSPTIEELSEQYSVSPKTILQVMDEGIQLGILDLLSFDAKRIPKLQIKNFLKPTSFQLSFLADVSINGSLTARKGRIHISPDKEKMMNNFHGDSNINASVGDGYFSTDVYRLESNEILMTKIDFESFVGEGRGKTEITLVKGV